MFRTLFAMGLAAAALVAGPAAAADFAPGESRLYLHLGPAAIANAEGAEIKAAGSVIPGADISIETNVTPVAEIGYFLNRNVAVSFTGGFPPLAKVVAAGTLAGSGTVGKTSYGPMALTAHYHFLPQGAFRPYIGAGPVFMYIFDAQDGLLTNLKVKHRFGFAVQAGAQIAINDRIGLFLDVKKARLRTVATANLGPAPVVSKIKMDPLVVHAGLALKL
jgi:outer membrane protein